MQIINLYPENRRACACSEASLYYFDELDVKIEIRMLGDYKMRW